MCRYSEQKGGRNKKTNWFSGTLMRSRITDTWASVSITTFFCFCSISTVKSLRTIWITKKKQFFSQFQGLAREPQDDFSSLSNFLKQSQQTQQSQQLFSAISATFLSNLSKTIFFKTISIVNQEKWLSLDVSVPITSLGRVSALGLSKPSDGISNIHPMTT